MPRKGINFIDKYTYIYIMLKKFLDFFHQYYPNAREKRLLIAVSGGVDSMVLVALCKKAGLHIAVAHCNFQLRGEDAIADEALVIDYCNTLKIPVHHIRFDTLQYAKAHQQSIQVAARTLRYDYFRQLQSIHQFDAILTAHHKNDNVETALFNLASGTGMRGMKGIYQNENQIFRPLLPFLKNDILAYAKINNIPYREDASNQSDKYSRNAIRLNIIPEFEKINPKFIANAANTLELLHAQVQIYDYFIKEIEKKILFEENNFIKITIKDLVALPEPNVILYELIQRFSFTNTQCNEIIKALSNHQSGKYWYSATHELIIDRTHLIIRAKVETKDFSIIIENKTGEFYENGIRMQVSSVHQGAQINADKNAILIDVTKIEFPLILRKWQAGDFFLPLNLKGKKKKIQDFLTDLKLSRFEKEAVWVLESAGKIVWLVGFQYDYRFVPQNDATDLLKIVIEK